MKPSHQYPYHFITYDQKTHTLTFHIHQDIVPHVPILSDSSVPTRFVRLSFPVSEFEYSIQGNFGINGMTRNRGIIDNYLCIDIPIPKRVSNGEDSVSFRDIQANLYLLPRILAATLCQEMFKESREQCQNMILDINIDRTRTTGAAGIAGSLSKFFQEKGIQTFTANQQTCRYVENAVGGPLVNVPRAVEAMQDLWAYTADIKREQISQSGEFHASIKKHGGFYMACPGTNGCSVSATTDVIGSMLDGPSISNHNMDSFGQQLTLFVGLVVLYDCVITGVVE